MDAGEGGLAVDAAPGSADASNLDGDADLPPPDAGPLPPAPLGTLRSFRSNGPINLDGLASNEWPDDRFVEFRIEDSAVYLQPNSNVAASASLRMASQYDDEFVYFYIQINDDVLVENSPNDIYYDDSIEISIGKIGGTGDYGDNDHLLIFSPTRFLDYYAQETPVPSGHVLPSANGYKFEFAYPRAKLGDPTANANAYAFNIAINDDDGNFEDSDLVVYGLWYMPPSPSSCIDCCEGFESAAWCDTTRLGTLELMP